MLKWLASKIRRIVGVILMKAQYWTAFGAMAIPLGASIFAINIALKDNSFFNFWMWVASICVVAGFIMAIAGWAYTIREAEEKKQRKEELGKIVKILEC